MHMLRDGEVDIIQTGISRSLMELDEGKQDAPIHIAEANQRDGFFIVSSRPIEGWTLKHLEGASLIPVGFTPVPMMSLKAVLNKHGVDTGKIRLIEGLSADDALQKFRDGEADYIHMVHPQAEQLIEDGVGYLAASIGTELGYICYSSFAVTPSFLKSKPDLIQRFVNGLYGAQKWVAENDVIAIAQRVAPFFPDVKTSVLEHSIWYYKNQNTWSTDPMIGEDGFDSMRDLLIDGGLVKGRHTYSRLVEPRFAVEAMQI
jgi:NitT/TauT family transport system substrate-binding protein